MRLYIYYSALCASFSGFLFGYETGSINGVKDMLGYRQALNISYISISGKENSSKPCNYNDDEETSAILGLMVSLAAVGGVLGSLVGGLFSDYCSRKAALILGSSLVALSGVIHASAVTLWIVLLSRIPAGIGIGILYIVTPIYVGEISPEDVRGRFLSVFAVWGAAGYLIAIIVNIFVHEVAYGWRISVGVQGLAGILMSLGISIVPRSPRLLLGVNLFLLGRLTGGNFLKYFSVSIFCKIGLFGFIVSLGIAGSAFLAILLSLIIVDKLGRKPLYLSGLGLMMVSFGVAAALILVFGLEDSTPDHVNLIAAYFTVAFICVNLAGFLITCGNIPWIIMGEIFPLPVKSLVTSVCIATSWIGIIVTNQLPPVIINTPLKVSGLLLLFLGATVIHYVYVLFFLPETKGITLENIEQLYSIPWRERVQVMYYVKCLWLCKPSRQPLTEDIISPAGEAKPLLEENKH